MNIDIKKDYSKNESVSNILETVIFTDLTSRGLGLCKVSDIIPYMELIATEDGRRINKLSDFSKVKNKLIKYIKEN